MIEQWVTDVIDNLHLFEDREFAVATIPRDEAVGRWVLRCLANPKCEGSAEVLDSIIDRRAFIAEG